VTNDISKLHVLRAQRDNAKVYEFSEQQTTIDRSLSVCPSIQAKWVLQGSLVLALSQGLKVDMQA
jgi:hypothetical protein